MDKTEPKLTGKQRAFVREYVIDHNGTRAALAAGYAQSGAHVQANRLLNKANVQAEIAKAEAKHAEECGLSAKFVLDGLMRNFERAMQEVEVTDREGNGLGEFKYEGSVANKALELMGKHLGLWVERQEVSGPGGGPQQHVNMTAEELAQMSDEDLERLAEGE